MGRALSRRKQVWEDLYLHIDPSARVWVFVVRCRARPETRNQKALNFGGQGLQNPVMVGAEMDP